MARAGILYSHVAKAAAQLAAAGKNPTVDSVREQRGGTGSKSTITSLLKQWKAQHQGETVAVGAGLRVDLLEAVKGVYERMQADAQPQVDLACAEHLAALEAVQDQLCQCQAHGGMLSQSAASLSSELAQTKEALARLQGAHQPEQITVAIVSTCQAAHDSRQHERASMAASEAVIGAVLNDFRNATDALVLSSSQIKDESIGIKSEVGEALVQLQFQDRVSQVMAHVKTNIARLPDYMEQSRLQFARSGVLCPLDTAGLLAELESTYAMADERALHNGSVQAGQTQDSEITFF